MAMQRVRFFVSNHVQDVGCRGFIISEMMFAGFERGNVINLSDGRVEVRIEGEENKIKEFFEELKKKLIAKYGNPVVRVSEMEDSPHLEPQDLMKTSQAHLLAQFDKGVGVMKSMEKHLEGIDKKLDEKFDGLPKQIGKELDGNFNKLDERFDSLPKRIANELDGNFKRLDEKFDSLPKRIANELDEKFDSLPKHIASELDDKFNNLPKQIASELDSRFDSLPKKMAIELKNVLKG